MSGRGAGWKELYERRRLPRSSCQNLSGLCTDSFCGDSIHCQYFEPGVPSSGIYQQPLFFDPAFLLDGISEYHPRFREMLQGDFCSDWNGDLLVAGIGGVVRRFIMSGDGQSVTLAPSQGTQNLNGAQGLDVAVGPDGTAYFATLDDGKVTYLKPADQQPPSSFLACPPGEICVNGGCEPPCVGDCNLNHIVSGSEIRIAINVLGGLKPLVRCAAADGNGNGAVTTSEIMQSVQNLGLGCPNEPLGAGGGASSSSTVTVDIGEAGGVRNQDVAVPISIVGGQGNVAAFQIDVLFDTAFLTIADPAMACVLEGSLQQQTLSATLPADPPPPVGMDRLRIFVGDLTYPISSMNDGTILSCTFHIQPNAPLETTTLSAEAEEVADPSAAVLTSTVSNGSILVCDGCGCS